MDTAIVKEPYEDVLSLQPARKAAQVVRQLDPAAWRRYVDHHPQGNIFHTPEMFEVFQRAQDFRPTLWAAIDQEDQVQALLLPVQVTVSPLLRTLTTRAISYGSILHMPTAEGRQALSQLLDAYVRENRRQCLFTELRNVADLENEQPLLQERGFSYEPHLNYLIDLTPSTEEVFLRIGPRTRKNLKRGLNKGEVLIREATRTDEVRTAYSLLSETYRAARVPLADYSLFEAAFETLRPRGMFRCMLAYVGTQAAAASIDLPYKDVIYGWYAGMDRAFSKFVPNDLLMWDVLKWGSENGYRLYDFGGAGRPDEEYGVRDFKAKFGGQLVCYGRNTYVHRPHVLWLSKQGYRVVRHLLRGRF